MVIGCKDPEPQTPSGSSSLPRRGLFLVVNMKLTVTFEIDSDAEKIIKESGYRPDQITKYALKKYLRELHNKAGGEK